MIAYMKKNASNVMETLEGEGSGAGAGIKFHSMSKN
jgi:hypothetical protein